jgi:hypothetical protein
MTVCDIDWQAVATLVTGLAAVLAATYVGTKQTRIADLKLRHDLFDRRYRIFETTKKYLGAVLAKLDYPDDAITHEMLGAVNEAVILFKPATAERIRVLFQEGVELGALSREMNRQYSATLDYGQSNINRRHEMTLSLSEKYTSLPKIFGDELRLWDR